MVQLADLPDELLLRILEELDGNTSVLHSLLLTSRRFHGLSIRPLYHSITLDTFRQLQALVDRRTSGAWKLPPESSGIQHIHINASYINDFNLSMNPGQAGEEAFDDVVEALGELVQYSKAGCLATLSIRIGPLRSFVSPQTDSPRDFFQRFLGIKARRVEFTTSNAPHAYTRMILHLWLDPHNFANVLAKNTHLEHLRLPFVRFLGSRSVLTRVLKTKRLRTLQLDWPEYLSSVDVANILVDLQNTLEDGGLILAAPASARPEQPGYLYLQFYSHNTFLDLTGYRTQASLITEDADQSHLLSKLDIRIGDFSLDEQAYAGQAEDQPAMIASDGLWMDLSAEGEQERPAGGTVGWTSTLVALVAWLWWTSR